MDPTNASRDVRDGPIPARLPAELASLPHSPHGQEASTGRSHQELRGAHVAAGAVIQEDTGRPRSSPPRATLEAPCFLVPNERTSGSSPVVQEDNNLVGMKSTGDGCLRRTTSPVDGGTFACDNLRIASSPGAIWEQCPLREDLPPVLSMPTVPSGEEVAAILAGCVDGKLVIPLEVSEPAIGGFGG